MTSQPTTAQLCERKSKVVFDLFLNLFLAGASANQSGASSRQKPVQPVHPATIHMRDSQQHHHQQQPAGAPDPTAPPQKPVYIPAPPPPRPGMTSYHPHDVTGYPHHHHAASVERAMHPGLAVTSRDAQHGGGGVEGVLRIAPQHSIMHQTPEVCAPAYFLLPQFFTNHHYISEVDSPEGCPFEEPYVGFVKKQKAAREVLWSGLGQDSRITS